MEETPQILNLRRLSREQRDILRRTFINQYLKTGKIAEPARQMGILVGTANGWINKFRRSGKVFRKEKRRGRPIGACKTLTQEEEQKLVKLLVDKTPRQYKFCFALWNARAVAQLIKVEFGKEMPGRTVRLYMQRLGFTAQRPEKRAREQRPA